MSWVSASMMMRTVRRNRAWYYYLQPGARFDLSLTSDISEAPRKYRLEAMLKELDTP